jgi:hypothetical protein
MELELFNNRYVRIELFTKCILVGVVWEKSNETVHIALVLFHITLKVGSFFR